MDPISQGFLGAIFTQSASKKREIRRATLIGFGAGMLADLDILIRSFSDPLLAVDYHRQFTHSLIFIPIGGFIAAVIFWLIFRKKIKFKKIYFYSTLGYATHCLLDACTTYGTELFWPFSDLKVAWNIVSVVDPLFTLVLAAFVIIGVKRKSVYISRIGLLFCISYLLFGLYQQQRAEKFLLNAAALRGHSVENILVHPTLGNLVLWRGIYQADGIYYVDAVRIGIFSDEILYQGSSIEKFDLSRSIAGIDKDSVLYDDIKRFSHFTNDYLVIVPGTTDVLGDLRYSALPSGVQPLWGIKIDKQKPGRHIKFLNTFDVDSTKLNTFWKMIKGEEPP